MLPTANARAFTFKEGAVGTYVRGEYGLMQKGDASYANSGGAGVTYDQTRTSEVGGEFGIFFASERSVIRISGAALLPRTLIGRQRQRCVGHGDLHTRFKSFGDRSAGQSRFVFESVARIAIPAFDGRRTRARDDDEHL